MIEFIAGISVGLLLGLVAGLVIAALLPRRAEQQPIIVVESSAPAPQPPAQLPQLPQPPVIVLAGIQRPVGQQETTALQPRR